ncbi:MAG: TauD/TfdA family dioxygenase [Myxococcota bacterium]|nr:TauD/TfdA family dioxygenase [Myxococcota bacterium]
MYPAVLEHPVTGRKMLDVVEQFLDRVIEPEEAGLTPEAADELLHRLIAHTRHPQFHYFHEWEPGDMILWDNRRAMHSTTGTKPGVRRVINRTTIEADVTLVRQLEAPAVCARASSRRRKRRAVESDEVEPWQAKRSLESSPMKRWMRSSRSVERWKTLASWVPSVSIH